MAGRPCEYTQEVGDLICERLSDGESLRTICAEDGMPHRATVFRWIAVNDIFRDQYARAREEQAEAMADEIVSIADEGEHKVLEGDGGTIVVYDSTAVARNRLRIDARKWVASKLKPKKYGEKLDLSHAGQIDSHITVAFVESSEAAD